MSYTVYLQCKDTKIQNTTIQYVIGGRTQFSTIDHDAEHDDTQALYVFDVDDGETVYINAIAKTSCSFLRWEYGYKSLLDMSNISSSNPFKYSGDQNIYIRAVGREEPQNNWICADYDFGTLKSPEDINFNIDAKYLRCCRVMFENDGTACIDVTSNKKFQYYFGTSNAVNLTNGVPVEYDERYVASTLSRSLEVTGYTDYYIWVRFDNQNDSGVIKIKVTPPDPQPELQPSIESFTVEQTGTGEKTANVSVRTTNARGCTLYIDAKAQGSQDTYNKYSKSIISNDYTSNTVISFDNFSNYDVIARVCKYGVEVTKSETIEIKDFINHVENISIRSMYGSTVLYLYIVGDSFISYYNYCVVDESGNTYDANKSGDYDEDTRTIIFTVKGITPKWDQQNNFTIKYGPNFCFASNLSVYIMKEPNAKINDLALVSRINGGWILSWSKPDTRVAKYLYQPLIGKDFISVDANINYNFYLSRYGANISEYITSIPIDSYDTHYSSFSKQSETISFISAPPRPTITTVVSGNTINGTWELCNSFYNDTHLSEFYVYIALYPKGGSTQTASRQFIGQTTGNFEFSNLSSGEYEIRASSVIFPDGETGGRAVWSVVDDGDDGSSNNGAYKYVFVKQITIAKTTIEKWDWNTEQGAATAAEVRKAKNAIDNKGKITDFSYRVWNAMVDRVKSIINTKGLTWVSYSPCLTYDDTLMTDTDEGRKLTAARFNSLRYNIDHYYLGSNNITGIGEVKSGDTVYGWYFTKLAECINLWIDYEGLGN